MCPVEWGPNVHNYHVVEDISTVVSMLFDGRGLFWIHTIKQPSWGAFSWRREVSEEVAMNPSLPT